MEENMLENVSEFEYGNLTVCNEDGGQKTQPWLDFENNSLIWYPPPALIVEDDVEMLFREEEEDGYMSDSGKALPSAWFSGEGLLVKEKPNHANKEPLRSTLCEHFPALVAQLLEEEDLLTESEDGGESWLEIVSSLARQAANFVKPDTSKGDSMDPGSYVKVKCISSGSPSDSMLVKGIVFTKNIKHKYMVSQHKNPRLLILGGALGVPDRLASIKSIHEQETDYLKMAVSKIEAHRPNVLLVEKTVSSYVQEYLLTRGISLVLDVKRVLLERISRSTGAQIASSVDNLASVRTGHCEMFRIVKEDLSSSSPSKKFVKTLMFFEGCPRRLGCTVLLKGACLEELKKVKSVIQFASFTAYHLSLESSYLADEGASLPKFPFISPSISALPNLPQDDSDEHIKVMPLGIKCSSSCPNVSSVNENIMRINNEPEEDKMLKRSLANPCDLGATDELNINYTTDMNCHPSPYFSVADNRESILVFLSSSCISKGTVCELSQLFCIKFYSTSDKPLGQYLRDDLFAHTSSCQSCQEPAEAHVRCYRHQQGSLTISVKRLPSVKLLSGEHDDRIWMWHRCLKCERKDGVPPAAHRVVMSDPASELSFGKFLELSFSKHGTANRVADCGHSLQRDCLRFYGLGSMVALFRYSPVDIFSVNLPPFVLDFSCDVQPEWMRREADLISSKLEYLHGAVGSMLCDIEQRMPTSDNDRLNASIQEHISDLRDLLKRERYKYDVLLHSVSANNTRSLQTCLDTLELNRLGLSLLIDSYTWDGRLHLLYSISKGENSSSTVNPQLLDSFAHSRLECNSNNLVEMDPLQNMRHAYTQRSLRATRSLNIGNNEMPSASLMITEGARFLLSRPGLGNIVILVYDDDPTSIISYAISSQEHTNFIVGKSEGLRENETNKVGNYFDGPSTLAPHEYGSHFHDDLRSHFYGSNDPQQLRGCVDPDPKESHFRFSFEDDSSIPSDKVKFSVTCYFARQFDALRKKCCPNEVDFIRSLSRCKPWKAQGGKSNVYFAKSWDERFIIKQVTKTELDSFKEFAPEYFKYLTESINNGSLTCLAKVLGIYQVNVKHLKGGREMKLDLIVTENLFFQRNISRVYDLKGSARSRYNPDTSVNKVLLDLNLLETLHTKPIFLGSKSKRTLERAVWSDTSFLESIDVMNYSMLVGVDEEKNELIIGIINFMRQYTWDKHLETWVKVALGILGGPKNVSPTVVSPKEYQKRFGKAMSSYFLTFPDQWSS